jgi:hypothetical protein
MTGLNFHKNVENVFKYEHVLKNVVNCIPLQSLQNLFATPLQPRLQPRI